MGENDNSKDGGLIINAGGNVKLEAGRDIIAGNQTITQYFDQPKNKDQKEEFASALEELRSQLAQLSSEISISQNIADDTKYELVSEISSEVNELEEENISESTGDNLKGTLDKAHTIFESLKIVGKDVVEFGTAAAPYIANGVVALIKLRSLLGLP